MTGDHGDILKQKGMKRMMRRRGFLGLAMGMSTGLSRMVVPECGLWATDAPSGTGKDEPLLKDLVRTAWTYFYENGHGETGLVRDRSHRDGVDERPQASMAAVGFGLTTLALAPTIVDVSAEQSWHRIRMTLIHIKDHLENHHGFFYHFVHWETGARYWNCEVSSIDTSLCLMGVLVCEAMTEDRELKAICRAICERVDWTWMLSANGFLSHGWRPESGFIPHKWDAYSELMHLYLLAVGSSTYPIDPAVWDRIERPRETHFGRSYINSAGAFFVHQFSHAWIDFRGISDRHANYFQNSVEATQAHRDFCLKHFEQFREYGPQVWGITASDSAHGYVAWGGPPRMGPIDGTVVPCAVAGSLPFTPALCLPTLHYFKDRWGDQIWGRYGFVDAFNPHTGWINPDVIGIDVGISSLMAMNLHSGAVWKAVSRVGPIQKALELCGFGKSE